MESALGSIISTTTSIVILSYIPVIRARKKNISIYVDYLRYLYDCFEDFKDQLQRAYYNDCSMDAEVLISYEHFVNIKNDHVLKINTDVVNNEIHFMTMVFSNDFQEYINILKNAKNTLFGSKNCDKKAVKDVMFHTYMFGLKIIYISQVFNDYCIKRYNKSSVDIDTKRKLDVEEVSVINRLYKLIDESEDTDGENKLVRFAIEDLTASCKSAASKTQVSIWLIYTKMYWKNMFSRVDCL